MRELSPRYGDVRTVGNVTEQYVGNGRWVDQAKFRQGFVRAMQRTPTRTYGHPPAQTARDLRCLMAEPNHQHCRAHLERV